MLHHYDTDFRNLKMSHFNWAKKDPYPPLLSNIDKGEFVEKLGWSNNFYTEA